MVVGSLVELFEYSLDIKSDDEISSPLLLYRPREWPNVDIGTAEGFEIEYDIRLRSAPVH